MSKLDDVRAQHEAKMAAAREIEVASLQLARDMKYPVDAENNVFFHSYMHPDLLPTLVFHLIRTGWRKDESKALVKQIPVSGAAVPEDFVTYVPLDFAEETLEVKAPEPEELWTVGAPQVNVIDEERSE